MNPTYSDGELAAITLFVLVSIVAYLLFLGSIHSSLKSVSQKRREMSPGLAWLNLVPIFNLFWIFYTAIKLSNSFLAEAEAVGMDQKGDGLKSLGIAYAGLTVATIAPVIGTFISLVLVVVWIVYWVKIVKYRNQLTALQSA